MLTNDMPPNNMPGNNIPGNNTTVKPVVLSALLLPNYGESGKFESVTQHLNRVNNQLTLC